MRARILIAEDDAILALRLRKTVEAMGYDVVGLAATGEDAIRLTEELRPDVVLMDVCLRGEMTGVLAATSIHAGGDTPIIYATAYSDDPLIQQAVQTAPCAYLTKPIRDRELHASIETALYRSRTDRALAHVNRVLRSVRDVNQLITRERDPQRLLDLACGILLETTTYGVVWTVQPDAATGRLRTRACAGAADGLLAWTARQCDTDGETLFTTVVRTERPWVTGEPLVGALDAPPVAGSVAIVPMRHGDRSYGCLCVHSPPPDLFGDEEIDLLEELAGDLAFALRGLEEEASRKRAEQALAESHESWRRLVEYQPTGNVVHRDGVILYANEACLRIVGLGGPNEAVGREVVDFAHPDSRAFIAGRLRELAQGGEPGTSEVKLARPDAEPVVVEMTSHRVTYLGQPAIQTVFWDVTERRRSEDELRRAQKLDSVGRLAAGVAHDFNNMLLAIIGHTQLLTETLHPSDPRVEHGEAIMAAAHRCSDLSRQLLAFSRRQVLDLRIVDMREVVTRIEMLLRGTLREDVRLQVVSPAEPCLVKADVGQLEQVLINLAVNAQDAMPTGGTLAIEVTPPSRPPEGPAAIDAPPGPCVAVVVRDTGCGMDAFTREHAFEPFFTTKDPAKGTGLGLAMVHGIVTQHGGRIQLASAPGGGTTFTISLPAAVPEAPDAMSPAEAASPTGTETVLIVEDTAAVLSVTATILRRHGYAVLVAESGAAALAALDRKASRIDLLLTDVVMPDMNGRELAARVTARAPAVKVLFMSGHDLSVVASHGVFEQERTLLAKPFSREDLVQRVRQVLDEG